MAVYDNRVEITSPGGLPRGQTAEEWGSGLRRVNRVLAEYGIRPVALDEVAFATQMNVYRNTAITLKQKDGEGNREGHEGNRGLSRV